MWNCIDIYNMYCRIEEEKELLSIESERFRENCSKYSSAIHDVNDIIEERYNHLIGFVPILNDRLKFINSIINDFELKWDKFKHILQPENILSLSRQWAHLSSDESASDQSSVDTASINGDQ